MIINNKTGRTVRHRSASLLTFTGTDGSARARLRIRAQLVGTRTSFPKPRTSRDSEGRNDRRVPLGSEGAQSRVTPAVPRRLSRAHPQTRVPNHRHGGSTDARLRHRVAEMQPEETSAQKEADAALCLSVCPLAPVSVCLSARHRAHLFCKARLRLNGGHVTLSHSFGTSVARLVWQLIEFCFCCSDTHREESKRDNF